MSPYVVPKHARGLTRYILTGIGSVIAITICKTSLDRIYIKLRDANDGVGLPEHRLPICIMAAFTLPLALLLYGWCAQYALPLSLLLISLIIIRMCIIIGTLPLIAYVVDASGVYSASAFTGVIVTRGLAGAFLPMGTAELVGGIGYGWGFTVLGAASLTLAIIPLLLFYYGARWRYACKYTMG